MILTTTPHIEGKPAVDYLGIVVGIDLDYETVGQGGSMLMVTVSGTAIRY
jgi:uncharacterized protein YbjQ (UPF0145 family)